MTTGENNENDSLAIGIRTISLYDIIILKEISFDRDIITVLSLIGTNE